VRETREQASEGDTLLEEQGLLLRHERIYVPNQSGVPGEAIGSVVLVYESTEAAAEGKARVESDISSANVTERELASGLNATVVAFENERGTQITIMIGERSNLIYYTIVATQESGAIDSEEYFIRMSTNFG